MEVTSINLGRPVELHGRSYSGTTGIFKDPVESARVDVEGLAGDAICDTRHHGGPDQALYLYRLEDQDFWSAELGRPIAPGTFGDNLTVRGLPEPGLPIGARLHFPDLVLEVTAPRIPCNTLAERMGDPGFARAFIRAERPGIYLRVIETGRVRLGDRFRLECPDPDAGTTVDLYRDSFRKLNEAEMRRWLELPIDQRTRQGFETRLGA
jgi:MOSC domain-containing protein YiiM